jgi:hypothetical protein
MRRGYKLDISNPDFPRFQKRSSFARSIQGFGLPICFLWLVISNVTVSYHSGGPLSTLFLKKVIRNKPQFSPPRFLCILPFWHRLWYNEKNLYSLKGARIHATEHCTAGPDLPSCRRTGTAAHKAAGAGAGWPLRQRQDHPCKYAGPAVPGQHHPAHR